MLMTVVSARQLANALEPMVLTPLPKVTEARFEQLLKASSPMVVT